MFGLDDSEHLAFVVPGVIVDAREFAEPWAIGFDVIVCGRTTPNDLPGCASQLRKSVALLLQCLRGFQL